MTALEIVRHFNAKKTGRHAWIAFCPCHKTHQPHLSIKEGKTGVLLTCWSQGCPAGDIVKAAGLTMSDLFYNSKTRLDPKAYQEMQHKQRHAELKEKELRSRIRYWTDETRKWETVAGLLHAHVVYSREMPEVRAIARLWRKSLATARDRHNHLIKFWPKAPEVHCYHLTRVPREITETFVGPEIATVLGLKK